MSDSKDLDEMLDGENELEEFIDELEESGLVVSAVEDGIVIGLTSERLEELLETADANEDKMVLLFVKKKSEDPQLKN